MAFSQICYLLLQLSLLGTAQHFLTLLPLDPVVSLGGSIILNCSINCPGGATTWKGLDTSLGGLYTGPGYSALKITNVSISMKGIKFCVGKCPEHRRKNIQGSLNLQVYALPQTLLLTAHPEENPPTLSCSMNRVYPSSTSSIIWYRGTQRLSTVLIEDEIEEDGHLLSRSLEIPSEEEWVPGTTYRCEVEVALGNHVFKKEATLQLPSKAGSTTEFPALVTTQSAVHSTTSKRSVNLRYTSPASTRDPTSTTPGLQQSTTLEYSTSQHGTIKLSTTHPETTAKMSSTQESISLPITRLETTARISSTQESISLPIARLETTAMISSTQESTSLPTPRPKTIVKISRTQEFTSAQQGTTQKENASLFPTRHATSLPDKTSARQVTTSLSFILVSINQNVVPTKVITQNGKRVIYALASALGLGGGLLLIVQLRRRLHRSGSFKPTLP